MSSTNNMSSKTTQPMEQPVTTKSDDAREAGKSVDMYEELSIYDERTKSGFFDEGSFSLAKQALSRKRLVLTTE